MPDGSRVLSEGQAQWQPQLATGVAHPGMAPQAHAALPLAQRYQGCADNKEALCPARPTPGHLGQSGVVTRPRAEGLPTALAEKPELTQQKEGNSPTRSPVCSLPCLGAGRGPASDLQLSGGALPTPVLHCPIPTGSCRCREEWP